MIPKVHPDMARESSLQAVYSAISHLQQEGEVLTVARVAREAGVGRSTLYRDDDDWNAVMAVIEGRAIAPAVVVDIALASRPQGPSRIRQLSDRVGVLEKELEEAVRFADSTYQKLIDQLQYYFALSHETPKRRDESRKRMVELAAAYDEIARLKQEVGRLASNEGRSNVVGAKGHKRHIVVPSDQSIAKSLDHFLAALHRQIPDKLVGKAFTSITFVCGLPSSGKSTWIDRQSALGPGISLFVEGSFHTMEVRSLVLGHVRRLCEAEVRCVWMFCGLETSLRRTAAVTDDHSIQELVRTIDSATELVSVAEGFDAAIGVRP